MLPDLKPHLLHAFMVVAAACAPVKSSPPPEPTPVRHCLQGEFDGEYRGTKVLPDGHSKIVIIGDPRYEPTTFRFTNRERYICAKPIILDFGAQNAWADPRA